MNKDHRLYLGFIYFYLFIFILYDRKERDNHNGGIPRQVPTNS